MEADGLPLLCFLHCPSTCEKAKTLQASEKDDVAIEKTSKNGWTVVRHKQWQKKNLNHKGRIVANSFDAVQEEASDIGGREVDAGNTEEPGEVSDESGPLFGVSNLVSKELFMPIEGREIFSLIRSPESTMEELQSMASADLVVGVRIFR